MTLSVMTTATKKTATKKVTAPVKKTKEATAPVKIVSTERIAVVKTNYHYFRHWLRSATASISGVKFVKNEDNYDGVITCPKSEVEKLKKVLADYRKELLKENPLTIEMWS